MGPAELELIERLRADGVLGFFPNLETSGFQRTSSFDPTYNCLAWALGWTHCRIDSTLPSLVGDYWPASVPRSRDIEALEAAYSVFGYSLCNSAEGAAIALYADARGYWTHAARRLPDGRWTSKLGDYDDIAHPSLSDLEGDCYGRVSRFLCKNTLPGEA